MGDVCAWQGFTSSWDWDQGLLLPNSDDVGWKPWLVEMLTGRNCRENANSKSSEGWIRSVKCLRKTAVSKPSWCLLQTVLRGTSLWIIAMILGVSLLLSPPCLKMLVSGIWEKKLLSDPQQQLKIKSYKWHFEENLRSARVCIHSWMLFSPFQLHVILNLPYVKSSSVSYTVCNEQEGSLPLQWDLLFWHSFIINILIQHPSNALEEILIKMINMILR